MNLLAFVGIISAIGMYSASKYIQHSKTTEAAASVEAIARGAAAYYDASDFNQPAGSKPEALRAMRHFPPASRGTVPLSLEDVAGKRYKSVSADWVGSPWHELHFTVLQPQCYAYSFEAEGAGQTAKAMAIAQGDLDGNGVWANYRLRVDVDDSSTARVAPTLERTNPEE